MKTFKISFLLFLAPSLLVGCSQQKKIYTITFDSNGGTPVKSQQVEEGGRVMRPDDPFHPDEEGIAYTFYNWCLDVEGKNEYNFSDIVTSDITLYAHWNMAPAPTPSGLDFTHLSIHSEHNITIAFTYQGTDLKVYWGDGSAPDSATSHTYQESGLHDIYITGNILTISFADEYGRTFSDGNSCILSIIFSNTIKYLQPYAVSLHGHISQVVIPNSIQIVDSTTFTNNFYITSGYCGAEEKPKGWDEGWDESFRFVYWNINLYLSTNDQVLYVSYLPTENANSLVAAVYYAYRNDITEITILDEIPVGDVNVPVVGIGEFAFAGLLKLQKVNTNAVKQLSYIGARAFAYTGLTSFTVPNTVTSIYSYAFDTCPELESIVFADGSNYQPNNLYTFYNCPKLKSIDFGNNSNMTTIRGNCFFNLPALETINFGNNSKLECIEIYSFIGNSLKSIILPSSLKTLEDLAFADQPLLEKVDMNAYTAAEMIPQASEYSFDSEKLITFYIHEGLKADDFTKKGWPSVDDMHRYVVGPMPTN